jgi:hypothetical protein
MVTDYSIGDDRRLDGPGLFDIQGCQGSQKSLWGLQLN